MKFTSASLGAVEGNLSNPTRILRQIGETMRGRIQAAFKAQSRGEFRWRERRTPNIMGIISDLERNSNVKERRFDSRPALEDTGNLLRSFGLREAIGMPTKYKVEVGTPLPYAPTLNVGGTSEKEVTPQVKRNLSIYLKRMRGQMKKAKKEGNEIKGQKLSDRARSLGWLFRKKTVRANIPARPFAIITALDLKDVVRIIKGEFLKRV